jgi:hypothetical protein
VRFIAAVFAPVPVAASGVPLLTGVSELPHPARSPAATRPRAASVKVFLKAIGTQILLII